MIVNDMKFDQNRGINVQFEGKYLVDDELKVSQTPLRHCSSLEALEFASLIGGMNNKETKIQPAER